MMGSKSGSLTIFLALSMVIFLTFCLVLTEGTRIYFLKMEAEQAMELAEFSVLSEYQYELLSYYGVFFLDLDYEQGCEQTAVLEQRVRNYLSENTQLIRNAELETGGFQRATDNGGYPFFAQAVELMKVKSGYKLLENFTGISGNAGGENVDLSGMLSENTGAAQTLLGGYVDEEGEPLFRISLPNISFPSVQMLTEAVLGSESMISEKSIDLQERLLQRTLTQGKKRKVNGGFMEQQLFHAYIFDHFAHYGSKETNIWKTSLEYQLEYIISGEESDKRNLENIMWRIFLLRAGGNYILFHQDAARRAQAEAEAIALVGITGNAAIIKAVQEILLIAQAIEEGIGETKTVFTGGKVRGFPTGIEMGYEQYLYLFLNTTNLKEKIYRSMDLTELEVREKSGYGNFRLDHCTDEFDIEWTWQADSIFVAVPGLQGGVYENTVTRIFDYEK